MILSDRTIKEAIEAGRIVVDPYDQSFVQPSSIDLRVDRFFRVFENHRYPYIDPKSPQEDLTTLIEAVSKSRSSCIRVSSSWDPRSNESSLVATSSPGWRGSPAWVASVS